MKKRTKTVKVFKSVSIMEEELKAILILKGADEGGATNVVAETIVYAMYLIQLPNDKEEKEQMTYEWLTCGPYNDRVFKEIIFIGVGLEFIFKEGSVLALHRRYAELLEKFKALKI